MSDARVIVGRARRAAETRPFGSRLPAIDAPPVRIVPQLGAEPHQLGSSQGGEAPRLEAPPVDVLGPGGLDKLSAVLSCPSLAARGPGAKPLGSLDTLRENLETRLFIQLLAHHGLTGLARRVQTCGSKWRVARLNHLAGCDEDREEGGKVAGRLVSNHCGVLGCPECSAAMARERGAELAARVALRLADLPDRLKRVHMLTLTLRSGLEAGETLTADSIRQQARRARALFRDFWRDHLLPMKDSSGREPSAEDLAARGCVVKVEFGSSGAVHLHALVVGFKYINNRPTRTHARGWLSRTWGALTGSTMVWVDEVREWCRKHRTHRKGRQVTLSSGLRGAVQEVAKYVAKPGHQGLMTVLTGLVTAGLYGERRWDSFGSLRLSKQERVERMKQVRWSPCPCCGSTWYTQGPWAPTPAAAVEAWDNEQRGLETRPRGPPPRRARQLQTIKVGLARRARPITDNELRRTLRARAHQLAIALDQGMRPDVALVELNIARSAANLPPLHTFGAPELADAP
jgi:hypothetical protein